MSVQQEGIEYLIDAEDRATAKVRRSAEEVERHARHVQEVGRQGKLSAESIGTLANAFGGAELGGFAGDVGELVERVSSLSEAAQGSGKAAMLMKGGLVAATAAGAVWIGLKLGDQIWGTERAMEALNDEFERGAKLQDRIAAQVQTRFQNESAMIASMQDAEARERALLAQQSRIDAEVMGKRDQVAQLQKHISDQESWWWIASSRDHLKQIELNKSLLEQEEARLDMFRQQQTELRNQSSEYQKTLVAASERAAIEQTNEATIKRLKRQLEEMSMSADDIELSAALDGVTGPNAAKQVYDLVDAIQAQRAATEAAEAAEQRRAEAEKRRLQEAAKLEQQRAREAIKNIDAEIKARQSALTDLGNTRSTIAGPNQAGQNQRMLTGVAGSSFQKTAETIELERQTKQQDQTNKLLTEIKELTRQKEAVTIKVLGDS